MELTASNRASHHADPIRLVLTRFIAANEERTYPEVPFQVDAAGFERIEISYHYDKSEGAVVDIGLRSPEQIIGWSGGARRSFHVGLEKATPGYLAGPMLQGEWAVLLGAYKVPAGGCEVRMEITLTPAHGRWMKGDLHMHSVHSDGSYTIAEAIEECRERGLEFMALTDHNTSSQNQAALAADEDLLLIPGVEMTSYYGHANVLGVPEALQDFRVTTADAASLVLGEAGKRGGFVSLNHPFCPNCPWELGFDVPYDAIEVWNGPWRELNEKAVRWWQGQLAQGRRIVALGGSDTHRPDRFVKHGRPAASIWTESDTVGGLLEGIRKGRVVLSSDPDETVVTLASGEHLVGDTIVASGGSEGGIPLVIDVWGARGDLITLWSDHGIEAQWQFEAQKDYSVWSAELAAAVKAGDETIQCELAALTAQQPSILGEDSIPVTAVEDSVTSLHFQGRADRLFYRVEARRSVEDLGFVLMTCMTNPIYIAQLGN